MAGARRCLYFAGTLAIAVLAALVPAEVAAASGRDPAIPSPDRRGADSDAPGPSSTGSGPGTADSTEPTSVPPTAGSTSSAPSTPPGGPTDPPRTAGPPAPASASDPSTTGPEPPPANSPAGPPTRLQVVRPTGAPTSAPVRAFPTTTPGAGWADVRGGGRGPDPGSQPRPVAVQPGPQDIGGANDPWSLLRGPEAGAHLFVAGFVALLFSIGGLVAVGIRRHRW
jgi:hypothetical protein